ncbi:MAG: FixH family protein [Verrucomicrobia bacterium]|nr:FixH family protein [Verrucomicrobiota bacterium]
MLTEDLPETEELPKTTGDTKKRGGWQVWLAALVLCTALVGGWFLWKGGGFGEAKLTERILSEQVGDYRIEIFGRKPQFSAGNNPVRVEVKDPATSQLVDAGTVTLRLNMDMPGMQMQADGVLHKGESPGIYTGTIRVGMAGEWIGRIGYEGPEGMEQKAITIEVKQ